MMRLYPSIIFVVWSFRGRVLPDEYLTEKIRDWLFICVQVFITFLFSLAASQDWFQKYRCFLEPSICVISIGAAR